MAELQADFELLPRNTLEANFDVLPREPVEATFEIKVAKKGDTGNGIESIEKTSTQGLVDTYTIQYTDGNSTTFDVTNGKDGTDGVDGKDATINGVNTLTLNTTYGISLSQQGNTATLSGKEITDAVDRIDSLIPAQATEQNQLADKNFVNSSIATNTANFIGTFDSVEELEAYSGTLTNNDYAFVVGTDSAGNTVYDRYKYTTATTPASWQFEYELNNSSFTADQWAAINSKATESKINQIETNKTAIGTLSSLTTTDKSNLVSAINELDSGKQPAGNYANTSLSNLNQTGKSKVSWYGTCSTAAATQTKDVVCDGFVLETGVSIRVKFTNNQNYNGNPLLNVNGTGAISIKRTGTINAIRYEWSPDQIVSFTYDGTNWIIDDGAYAATTAGGKVILSGSATSTSTTTYAPTLSSINSLVQNMIEPYAVYSSSSTYKVGDMVRYNYNAWECNTAITTAESWNSAHWTALPAIQDQLDITNNRVSNVITEIPQDINLTLENGTLTLKSGSVITYANGSQYQVTSDKTIVGTYQSDGQTMVFSRSSDGAINLFKTDVCFSGTTDPMAGSSTQHIWFDTSSSHLYRVFADGTTAERSLPCAIITVSSGVITSIDKVFNGAGYIGHHAFVLPDFNGLIPNGFNSDGTLKTISKKTSSLLIQELNATNNVITISTYSSVIGRSRYNGEVKNRWEIQEDGVLYYVADENLIYSLLSSVYTPRPIMPIIYYSWNTTDGVTQFDIRPVYRVVTEEMLENSIPVKDVTVNGTSVVSNGVAVIPAIPTSSDYWTVGTSGVSDYQTTYSKKTIFYTASGAQDNGFKMLASSDTAPASTVGAWSGRCLIGNEKRTFLLGTARNSASDSQSICGLGAHTWGSASSQTSAGWDSVYIQPDGSTAVYLGGNGWRGSSGWFRVLNNNSGSASYRVTINTGSNSSPAWKTVLPNNATGTSSVLFTPTVGTTFTYTYATSVNGTVTANYGTSYGYGSSAAGSATGLGYNAKATGSGSIQLGQGTNSTANTLSVGLSSSLNVQLLDSTGVIPAGRLNIASSVSSSSTNSQMVGAKLFYDTVGDIETLLQGV